MKLSEHFTLAELTKSHTAARLGIDNSLNVLDNAEIINNLTQLCERVLEPIRSHCFIPFTPNSGYRCYALEQVLCRKAIDRYIDDGAGRKVLDYLKMKPHPKGQAVDIEIPGHPNLELARWVRDNLEFDQLLLEFYSSTDPAGGWVHVSYRADGTNRNEVLTIGKGTNLKGLPEGD